MQFREARRPEPALGAESVTIGGNQRAQGIKALEHRGGEIERRVARRARAQQDGQQFRVGQRRGAFVQQLLARSFVAGPIPNCHAPEHDEGRFNSLAAFRWRATSYGSSARRTVNPLPWECGQLCPELPNPPPPPGVAEKTSTTSKSTRPPRPNTTRPLRSPGVKV